MPDEMDTQRHDSWAAAKIDLVRGKSLEPEDGDMFGGERRESAVNERMRVSQSGKD